MTGFIDLDGVDYPLRADVYQTASADSGRVVIDCGAPRAVRRLANLSLFARETTLRWRYLRLMGAARWYGSYVRLTYEDSRWLMRSTRMSRNWNEYTIGGVVSNERTIDQLWADIGAECGLTIAVDPAVPDVKPPAQWQGRTARDCAQELLDTTCCHMLPTAELPFEYRIMPAGQGAVPDFSQRFSRSVPNEEISELRVRTAPKLYESAIDLEARLPKATGGWESFADAGLDATDFFSGFESQGDNRRTSLHNSAFRVWEMVGADHPAGITIENMQVQPFRAMPNAKPEVIGNRMTYFPRAILEDSDDDSVAMVDVKMEPGSNLVFTNEPVIRVDANGDVQTTAKLVAAYYAFDFGVAEREQVTRSIGRSGGIRWIDYDWLKPVDSIRWDAAASVNAWEKILDILADANAQKYRAQTEQISVPSLQAPLLSGQIGAMRYQISLHPRRRMQTTYALNHMPKILL